MDTLWTAAYWHVVYKTKQQSRHELYICSLTYPNLFISGSASPVSNDSDTFSYLDGCISFIKKEMKPEVKFNPGTPNLGLVQIYGFVD